LIRSDRRFAFDRPAADVWEVMARTSAYTTWWPWLRRLDATGLVAGDVWSCHIQPPLPYFLRFTITLDEVVPGRSARATVAGDISGTAEFTLVPTGNGGCEGRLVSDLGPASPVLRAFAAVARPLVVWGHDWVLAEGIRQFTARGLGEVPDRRGPTP
jgi:uncharacterized protein YndB with AHSA1/START domain